MKKEPIHILTPGWETDEYRKMIGGNKGKSSNATFDFSNAVYHYWISNKHGYAMSSDKKCPSKTKGYKYMGFSADKGWPKRMSTGRLITQEIKKPKKKVKDSLADGSKN